MLAWYKVLTYGKLVLTNNGWRDPSMYPPKLYNPRQVNSLIQSVAIPNGWNRDNIQIKSASVSF